MLIIYDQHIERTMLISVTTTIFPETHLDSSLNMTPWFEFYREVKVSVFQEQFFLHQEHI